MRDDDDDVMDEGLQDRALGLIDQQQWLDAGSDVLQRVVREGFAMAGAPGRMVKDVLHGKWLGHPLHPVLTDIPVGAWTAAAVLDTIDAASANDAVRAGADTAIAIGLVGAVGSAVTGLTDWAETGGDARKVGSAHALFNITATALYATSLVLRKSGARRSGRAASFFGLLTATAGAYLGGHLVYEQQVGVDHSRPHQGKPKKYTAAVEIDSLEDDKPSRGDAGGTPVAVVQQDDEIYAVLEICPHQGGPLSKGNVEGRSIRCPWHGSRFDLATGEALEGPSVYPVPCMETRKRKGTLEVRAKRE